MCWMGLARAEQGLERPEATAAAIAKAQALAPKSSAKEQTFIALRAQQIEAQNAPRAEESEKHAAYKKALDKALASYPEDAELWILRGNAEEAGPWGRGQFGRPPRSRSTRLRSSARPGTSPRTTTSSIPSRTSPTTPRPRSTGRSTPPRARAWRTPSTCTATCCRASGAGKRRSRSSRRRTRSRKPTRRPRTSEPGDDWHHLHNLQLLGYTYLRLQRVDDAEKTFRRAFDTPARLPYRGTPQASLAEFYLLRGQADQALAVARALQVDTRTPATRVVAIVVEGEALLAKGQTDAARGRRPAREEELRHRQGRPHARGRAISTVSSRLTSSSSTPRSRSTARTPRTRKRRSGRWRTTSRRIPASTPGARASSASTAWPPTRGARGERRSRRTSRPR